ncbi:unnamed protein product [Allacma fusca]|uniref:Uncharacterized protein n=1 Tax=Allacma fusca TaxID=39272 RepID=A0A8J2NR81_9HEXA|nr:unnamed protein product [Allacma fusca]
MRFSFLKNRCSANEMSLGSFYVMIVGPHQDWLHHELTELGIGSNAWKISSQVSGERVPSVFVPLNAN